jgi:dihydropyrimidinase
MLDLIIRSDQIATTALYMMHASGVEAIRAARAKHLPIYGETLHEYIMYTSEQAPESQWL